MTQGLAIRPIGPADIGLLGAIDARVADDPQLRGHIAGLLGAGFSWAAFAGAESVGFVVVTRHFFGFPFVDLLFVAEARRREGFGRALMAHCEVVHDADRIFTSTNESNAPMRALLADMGWRLCGHVDALDEGDPELFFVKFR